MRFWVSIFFFKRCVNISLPTEAVSLLRHYAQINSSFTLMWHEENSACLDSLQTPSKLVLVIAVGKALKETVFVLQIFCFKNTDSLYTHTTKEGNVCNLKNTI